MFRRGNSTTRQKSKMVDEEFQLIAEQKWILEALNKIKKQRNALEVERLQLESVKESCNTVPTDIVRRSSQATGSDKSKKIKAEKEPQPSTSKASQKQEAEDLDDAQCFNRKALDLSVMNSLDSLGSIPLTDQVVANAEEFVVQLYKVSPEIKTGDAARSFLFGAVKNVENLPPTSGSLRLHIRRCHYQVCVWESAHIGKPSAPSPEDCGWRVNGTSIEPILMTLPPIPASCDALRSCGCKGLCQTNQCRCKKGADPCMKICNCRALCLNLLG